MAATPKQALTRAGTHAGSPRGGASIDVHVGDIRQLFNSMDPSPFRERDLDPQAEAYIVDSARTLSRKAPLLLAVSLSGTTSASADLAALPQAVHEYFAQRSASTRTGLRRLLRIGGWSLLIGVSFVAATNLIGDWVHEMVGSVLHESFMIGDVYVDMQRILIVIAAVVLVFLLWLFVHHTSLGLAFRGIAQDERTALTFGMDSDWIATLSVSLGAGLAAIAATIIIPLGTISVSQGYDVLINALAVSIIGGLGSTGGVIVASLVVGFAQRFTDTYIGSHWTMIVSLVAILIVLVIKPSGLYGKQKELEERI